MCLVGHHTRVWASVQDELGIVKIALALSAMHAWGILSADIRSIFENFTARPFGYSAVSAALTSTAQSTHCFADASHVYISKNPWLSSCLHFAAKLQFTFGAVQSCYQSDWPFDMLR